MGAYVFENDNSTGESYWLMPIFMRSSASGAARGLYLLAGWFYSAPIRPSYKLFQQKSVVTNGLGRMDQLLDQQALPIWRVAIYFVGLYEIKNIFFTHRLHEMRKEQYEIWDVLNRAKQFE